MNVLELFTIVLIDHGRLTGGLDRLGRRMGLRYGYKSGSMFVGRSGIDTRRGCTLKEINISLYCSLCDKLTHSAVNVHWSPGPLFAGFSVPILVKRTLIKCGICCGLRWTYDYEDIHLDLRSLSKTNSIISDRPIRIGKTFRVVGRS